MSVKRLIYISAWDFTDAEYDGVCKKILSQIKVFRKAGFTVDYTYIKDGSTWIGKDEKETLLGHNHHLSKFAAHRLIAKYLKKYDDYKYVYVRYNKADPYFISIVRTLKEYGAKIIVEIPTYPYDNECKSCLRDRAVLCVDKLYRNKIQKYIDSFASYSDDKTIFGAPSMHIINGIDVESIKPLKIRSYNGEIRLIGVASLAKWHGYDRILVGMHNYYSAGGDRNIHFDIVGDGVERKSYGLYVKKNNLADHVTFWGYKSGNELDEIYNNNNIAVASLGIHRIGITGTISILKSREYAVRGIPFITSCEIDIFPSQSFDFVMKVEEDDSPINMNDVVAFGDRVLSNDNLTEKIRHIGLNTCGMDIAMSPIVDIMNNTGRADENTYGSWSTPTVH